MWIQSNCEIIMLIKDEWNAYKWWWKPNQKSKWRMGSCFEIFRPQKNWIQLREKISKKSFFKLGYVASFFRSVFERNRTGLFLPEDIFNWNSATWIQLIVTLLDGRRLKKKGFLVLTNLFPSVSIVQKELAEKSTYLNVSQGKLWSLYVFLGTIHRYGAIHNGISEIK